MATPSAYVWVVLETNIDSQAVTIAGVYSNALQARCVVNELNLDAQHSRGNWTYRITCEPVIQPGDL